MIRYLLLCFAVWIDLRSHFIDGIPQAGETGGDAERHGRVSEWRDGCEGETDSKKEAPNSKEES